MAQMQKISLTDHLIDSTSTLMDALARINALSGGAMTLFVISETGRLAGSITDGDIRRALLRGVTPADSVAAAMKPDCRSVGAEPDPGLLRQLRRKGITLVPVVDGDGRVTDIINLSGRSTRLPLRALLMAGGKGERLRPATLTCPKPLLKIEGKAIIDYNVEALAACGISDITVSTGYLAEQLDSHFAAPVAGVQVRTMRESTPLGTIGAAAMLPESGTETLVMNSDLLTTVSFEEMYLRHRDSGAAATVAVIPYVVSVPFAILTLDQENPDSVSAIEEKPSYSYFANAGIYIFRPEALALIEPGERTDATDLLERVIAAGMKVSHYPIDGTWIDVGSPADFRQAGELMRHFNTMKQTSRG